MDVEAQGQLDIRDGKSFSNRSRKCFGLLKMLLFACCLTGFLFQSVEFLGNFLKYPSVVSLSFKTMEAFPTPAITVCSEHWYVQTKVK